MKIRIVEKVVEKIIGVPEFILTEDEALAVTRLFGSLNKYLMIESAIAFTQEDYDILYDAWDKLDDHFREEVGLDKLYEKDE